MKKLHYRAVILVLASNNNTIYKNARNIWKKYMHVDPEIKVFFVYGKLSENLLDKDESDLIYDDIKESYPVYIEKTIRAMEFIHKNFTYDYFIRTNLTTFWDFKKLHNHLETLPKDEYFYSGDGPLYYCKERVYLSGTDTIVAPKMIDALLKNRDKINYSIVEDAAMGLFFHGYLNAKLLPNRIVFFEDIQSIDETPKIIQRINYSIDEQKDHYRVKNNDREQIDLYIYKILLKKIYNIDY